MGRIGAVAIVAGKIITLLALIDHAIAALACRNRRQLSTGSGEQPQGAAA
jgi:hypothetical protein